MAFETRQEDPTAQCFQILKSAAQMTGSRSLSGAAEWQSAEQVRL
jgi:hypothetical protein